MGVRSLQDISPTARKWKFLNEAAGGVILPHYDGGKHPAFLLSHKASFDLVVQGAFFQTAEHCPGIRQRSCSRNAGSESPQDRKRKRQPNCSHQSASPPSCQAVETEASSVLQKLDQRGKPTTPEALESVLVLRKY